MFNLLPIPPLDGFNILANLLPCSCAIRSWCYRRHRSLLLLLVLILPGDLFWGLINPPVSFLRELLFGF